MCDRLMIFHCPSDGAGSLQLNVVTNGSVAASGLGSVPMSPVNIRFSFGDAMWNADRPDWSEDNANAKCSSRGMFVPYYKRNFSYVSDGLSNTIVASEGIIAEDPADRLIKRAVERVDGIYANTVSTPLACVAAPTSATDPNMWPATSIDQ